MDTHQQTQPITTVCTNGPSQLWIGPSDELVAHVHTYMQQRWCSAGGCKRCTTCSLIEQHQYHSALWVAPQGNYTRDALEVIFSTIQFALDEDREMIIVIQRADYLTAACYNSLLKSIEEPPRGYHFLLLAERIDAVAATIRSRCTIKHFAHTEINITQHPLAKFFISDQYENPSAFMQALDIADPDEHESAELIDSLVQYWTQQYTKNALTHDSGTIEKIKSIIAVLHHALEEPPMAGSSKLFWKNLFVHIKK